MKEKKITQFGDDTLLYNVLSSVTHLDLPGFYPPSGWLVTSTINRLTECSLFRAESGYVYRLKEQQAFREAQEPSDGQPAEVRSCVFTDPTADRSVLVEYLTKSPSGSLMFFDTDGVRANDLTSRRVPIGTTSLIPLTASIQPHVSVVRSATTGGSAIFRTEREVHRLSMISTMSSFRVRGIIKHLSKGHQLAGRVLPLDIPATAYDQDRPDFSMAFQILAEDRKIKVEFDQSWKSIDYSQIMEGSDREAWEASIYRDLDITSWVVAAHAARRIQESDWKLTVLGQADLDKVREMLGHLVGHLVDAKKVNRSEINSESRRSAILTPANIAACAEIMEKALSKGPEGLPVSVLVKRPKVSRLLMDAVITNFPEVFERYTRPQGSRQVESVRRTEVVLREQQEVIEEVEEVLQSVEEVEEPISEFEAGLIMKNLRIHQQAYHNAQGQSLAIHGIPLDRVKDRRLFTHLPDLLATLPDGLKVVNWSRGLDVDDPSFDHLIDIGKGTPVLLVRYKLDGSEAMDWGIMDLSVDW